MNYYSHHIGDYRRDTAHLSLLEHGVYRQLLDMYYLSEEPIPEETEVVFRRLCARTEEEKKAVITILKEFFKVENGWAHKRCDEQIHEYQSKAERARTNGKLGGRPSKTKEVIFGNQETSEEKANHKPLTTNHKPPSKVKPTVPASAETAEVFEYWKQVMNHPAAQLDAKRSKNIGARLKDGYTVSQLCRAVDGCKYDPFSQGANDRQTVYDDIELICRDGPKVDKFMAIADRGPQQIGRTVNQQKTLTNLERYLQENPS